MLFLLSLPLAIIAFIFESYPRFINRKYGVDVWTHLLYLKEFHKQKGIPGNINSGFIIPGKYDYPPAFITILSLFPFKLVERYEFIFSPFFDSLHIVLIFFISYFLSQSLLIALLTQLLYILTPIIILENASATPRSLGYFLFTILMISTFLFMQSGNLLLLALSLISGSLIFLTHRFTTQGFLFLSIIFSIIEKNLIFVILFCVCFLLSIIISKGFYLTVLKGHIGNLKFWKDNIRYRFAHQVKGNLSVKKTKDFIFRIYNQFLKFPPFVLAITNPWVLPVIYVFIIKFPTEFITQRLIMWVLISYVLSLITIWIPKLRFLGEGQRYLELSAFPAAYLSSKFFFETMNSQIKIPVMLLYFMIGISALITILVIQIKAIIKEKLRTVTPEMEEMFLYLKKLKHKPRLLCIPHQITTNTIYHTGCSVLVNANYKDIYKISDIYPYLRIPVKKIMHKYNLNYILLNEDYANVSDLKIKSYKIVKQIGNFILFKI